MLAVSSLLKSALSHHQNGDLTAAEALYQKVIEIHPGHCDALRLLSTSARQRRDYARARNWINQCISLHPGSPDAFHELGQLMFDLGEISSAVAAYERAIQLAPSLPDIHYNLGNAYYALRQFLKARAAYATAARLDPAFALAHFNRGIVEQEMGNHEAAVEHYQRALSLCPGWVEAHLNIALSYRKLNDHNNARASLNRALVANPNSFEALVSLGTLLRDLGELQESEARLRQALTLRPDASIAYLSLASTLEAANRLQESEACLKCALKYDPHDRQVNAFLGALMLKQNRLTEASEFSHVALIQDPEYLPARLNISQLLLIQNRLDEAAAHCDRILKQDPLHSDALVCLGVIHTRQRRPLQAKECLRKALIRSPENADALVNLGICELLLGEFESGWRHYEARWQSNFTCCKRRSFSQPEWNGEPLAGKTVLVTAEQGFGDTLQFVRYTPLIVERGGRVLIECHPTLKQLIETATGVSQVVTFGEPLPKFDVHVPLLSLPRIFKTTVETIPARVPYLRVPGKLPLPAALKTASQFRVGLVWCGSRSQNDDQRPVPLVALAPIFDNPAIDFYSLQLGDAARELAAIPSASRVRDLSSFLLDFSVTASVIAELDLIISIDTAVAHLAGALGRPTWILLPFAPDWRWMLEGDTNPWYPTARLFRQTRFGDWSEPVQRIAKELAHRDDLSIQR